MTGSPRFRPLLRVGTLLATAVLAFGLGLPRAGAAGTNSSDIVYTTNPPHTFAFSSLSAGTSLTPSYCEAHFGLACYTPSLIRSAYNVPSTFRGAGQTIAIVDAFGSPTIANDLHVFDQAFGLPDPVLNVYYPTGQVAFTGTALQQDWAGEVTLDVEWAHAIAPQATIDLVVASSPYGNVLNNAEQFAVQNLGADVMSMSFGAPEGAIAGGGNNLQLLQADQVYQQAAQAGVTVVASAGDSGASNGYSFANAGFPASDPNVLSVGGTNLFISDKGQYQSENVWNDSDPSLCPFGCDYGVFGATGGAPSSVFGAPSWQNSASGQTTRTVADVSYNASVYTGILAYLSYIPGQAGFYFFGGTSEGAPQWSAIVALADQAAGHKLGFITPTLYSIAADKHTYGADFHDVTVGQNALNGPGFSAGTGYDLPTGLGTPNVANLISTLSGH